MSRFQGKGVLVTGAASGIGKATVERLIGEGATVVGVDLDSDAPAGLGGDRFDYRVLGTAGGPAYNATEGGVVLLTKNTAIDYGPSGIRVNVIWPGFIETPMFDSVMGMPGFEGPREARRHEHKLRRFGRAEEIASVPAFLLSTDASFVSGQAIALDGGYTAGRDHGVTELMGLGER
jgi:NAD(P)-dependent dehydrogenase (short-subunit alcohol dehydrogenase family)